MWLCGRRRQARSLSPIRCRPAHDHDARVAVVSKSMRGAMQVFGQHFTCFALDNPGFGLSEPLPIGQGDMAAHADALKDTIDALELEHPVVYGASTGAAIAHAFGCKYPTASALCMLDTFSHYDTDDTLEGYFPDVIPRRDGGHLLASWEKISGLYLFSPWQKAEPSRRQVRDFPEPAMLHDMVLQLLCAGTDYKQLYAGAIAWEDAANVDRLSAPQHSMSGNRQVAWPACRC